VGRIVALLESQGWSAWWDARIVGRERWDATKSGRSTPRAALWSSGHPGRSSGNGWQVEAHHGRKRGVLIPILIDLDEPPLAFSLIQARKLTGWDGVSKTSATDQFLADVRAKLGVVASPQPSLPDPARYHVEGRIKVGARIIHGAPNAWFKPGAGKAEWFKNLDAGPEMVVVPAGEFMMGSNEHETQQPSHNVTIAAPFAVGRFAVTYAEWDATGLAHKPHNLPRWGRGRQPVIYVSWEDAKAYVDWLSQRTGKAYRLLSEAEWEYSCRAGTITKYAFGNSITNQQAQFSEREYGEPEKTVEVGRFTPNAWGLYDMHGNVWEWCSDNSHRLSGCSSRRFSLGWR
jgi:formylglycine-generating enzyme required for sulfatase activity